MKHALVFALLMLTGSTFAQSVKLYGQIRDQEEKPIPGATVMLVGQQDSILKSFAVSDKAGTFTLSNVKPGDFVFKVSFFGFQPYEQQVHITAASQDTAIGVVKMMPKMLGEVTVQGHYVPIAIKGDTIEYDSRAFATDEHDMVEDLLQQLPGIEVNEDGTIKAQGKDVEKILVDGEEFFSDDPTIATKNLPANAVEKVQVFDKQSDMSEFTGVDDGTESTTINLKLKSSHKKGFFGNLEMAGGSDAPVLGGEEFNDYARYLGKGNVYYFKKKLKLSLIGMSNNVNQTGFSIRDYMNFMGGVSNMMKDGGMSWNLDGAGIPISRGGGSNDGFLNTNAAGFNINYVGDKQTILNGSYFFSNFDNTYINNLQRETYFSDSTVYATESVNQTSVNYGNTVNIHMEQKVDSTHFLNVDLRGSWNWADYFNGNYLNNYGANQTVYSTFNTDLQQDNWNYDYTTAVDYRKKFAKAGRYTGGGVSYARTNSDSRTTLDYLSDIYAMGIPYTIDILQMQNMLQNTANFKADWMFSEPVGKRNLIQLQYAFRHDAEGRDKDVYDVDSDGLESFNDYFSAQADYLKFRHNAQLTHKFIGKKVNTTMSANYQYLNLSGPQIFTTPKEFHYVTPSLRVQWDPNKNSDVRFTYNTSLTVPTLNQLQPLPDNSNPSEVIKGNTNLEPEYNHNVNLRFHNFNEFNFTYFMVNVGGAYVRNNITYSQKINEFLIRELTPENIGDEKSANAYVAFGASIHPIFTKFNISNSANVSNGLINLNSQQDQYTSVSTSPRLTIENIDKKVVNFRTGFGYTWSKNIYKDNANFNSSFQNYNYFANLTLKLKDRVEFSSDITHYFYPAFQNNSQQVILNTKLAFNLTKSRKLQLYLAGYDLLNQNTGISQYYFQNIYERETTTTLARYFMVGMKFSFQKMGASSK